MKSREALFHFKKFSVTDQNSALKIGTDAVLLGAWARIEDAKSILDVGCGNGIIALMLAQQNGIASIDAIDNHEGSINDAIENFTNSRWTDRLTAIQISWNEFLPAASNQYDVIVSNPPYFIDSLKSSEEKKNRSKHADSLNAALIILSAKDILTARGRINLILPFEQVDQLKQTAFENDFFVSRECIIIPKPNRQANRVLLELCSDQSAVCQTTQLIIRNKDNSYTEEYKFLTKEFYLTI